MPDHTGDARRDRILVFIPSFNDSTALPDLAAGVAALGPQYRSLLIDDGSSSEVLPGAPVQQGMQARLPANFGLGTCTHIALSHALRHGYAALVRVDADGQHAVTDIPRLLSLIESGTADVAVGVRVNHSVGRSAADLARRAMKAYFRLLARALTGGRAPRDVNSGFFAINRRAMAILSRTEFERFPEPEMFVTACRAGLTVVEVEVQQRARVDGETSLRAFAALRMFFRFNVFAFNEVLRGRRRP